MYHFIGIKGAGMSSLALILFSLGNQVQGSDVAKYFFTEKNLREKNIKILPFNEDNIVKGLTIIQGNAFNDNNIEVKKANKLNLKIYTYQEMLTILSREFKTISVAGCHGKTTTSSLLSHILNNTIGTNYLIGDGNGFASNENELFVLEACEYKRHFLDYEQVYGIITNIDLDHVDYYKNIDNVIDAYQTFCNNVKNKVIVYGDEINTRKLEKNNKILYYGFEDNNDIVANNIIYKEDYTSFDVYINNEYLDNFILKIPGKHMVLNALPCIYISYIENVSLVDIKKYLKTFKGANRRFTESILNDNIIIDDYAHHPKEVNATIDAVKQKYPNKKIITVFQPHTFSRTKMFASLLAEALNKSEASYILDIYPSREKQEDYPSVTSDLIINKLNNGFSLSESNVQLLTKYRDAVIIFMSPNDLSWLIQAYKNKTINK